MRVTIKEVAKLAGVSPSTVTRVVKINPASAMRPKKESVKL